MDLYDLLSDNKSLNVTINAGQLIEVIDHRIKIATKPDQRAEDYPKYVKGLKGIRQLFNVSHATAQKYKDTILKDAVSQQGRVIITDVEKAFKLFNERM